MPSLAHISIGETPYILRDPQSEEMFQMTILSSLERAHAGKLLSGCVFLATPNVNPSFDHLQLIIECAGGEVSNHMCMWEMVMMVIDIFWALQYLVALSVCTSFVLEQYKLLVIHNIAIVR